MDLIREELNAELLNNTGGLHNAVEEVLIGAMGVQNALHLFKKGVLIITPGEDRKSTRLNSSHLVISYAVFCLKKQRKRHSIASRPSGVAPATVGVRSRRSTPAASRSRSAGARRLSLHPLRCCRLCTALLSCSS